MTRAFLQSLTSNRTNHNFELWTLHFELKVRLFLTQKLRPYIRMQGRSQGENTLFYIMIEFKVALIYGLASD